VGIGKGLTHSEVALEVTVVLRKGEDQVGVTKVGRERLSAYTQQLLWVDSKADEGGDEETLSIPPVMAFPAVWNGRTGRVR
jgi:hypothetical protein